MRPRYVIVLGLFAVLNNGAYAWATHLSSAASDADSLTSSQTGSSTPEYYVSGYGGYAFSGSLKNLEYTGLLEGVNLGDIKHNGGGFFGGKFGAYMHDSYFGAEVEAFYARLSIPNQTLSVSGTARNFGVPVSGSAILPSSDQNLYGGALNILLRYPGKVLQPYVGIGLAIVHLENTGGADSSSTSPGLSALAGIRAKVTERISVFGEFKYIYSSFEFKNLQGAPQGTGLKGDLNIPTLVGGVAFNF